jgi:WD40 repeat protein
MRFPITSLSWKPTLDFNKDGPQFLLGSCCDGSVVRWNSYKPDKLDHIQLDGESEYRSLGYSNTGRRFAIAGSKRDVQVYDDERVKLICSFTKEKE